MARATVVHGWRDGDKYFTSLKPKSENAPKNTHASSQEALREASRRKLQIVWEDPSVVE